MRATGWISIIFAAGLVAGCGGKGPGPAGSAGVQEHKETPTGNATAEEVAEESRGRVRCPAKISSPPRADGAPVDDVLGVRPGMTFDEAANVVMCSNDLIVVTADTSQRFNIQTYGQTLRQGFSARFAEPRVEKSSKQIMQEMQDDMFARSGNAVRQDMKPGQSKWYVSTMGMPGEERVIAAAREEWFAEGRNPTMASVEEALIKKYGAPNKNQKGGNQTVLSWAYDPLGRKITETSSLFYQCSGNPSPDGGTNFSPDCGTVVAAMIVATQENPALAKYMQVSTSDQASGYERITGTEQALQKMDADRKAREVKEAGKNADAPQL